MEQLHTIPTKPVTTREDVNAFIEIRRQRVRQYIQEKLKEYNMTLPLGELRFGLFSISDGNPYDEIINIANYINNSLLDGWFFFFEAERLRREVAALRGRKIEDASCRVIW